MAAGELSDEDVFGTAELSDEDVFGAPATPVGPTVAAPKTWSDELARRQAIEKRRLELAPRALARAATGTPAYLADLYTRATNSLGLSNRQLPSAALETLMDQLGLAKPQTTGEELGSMAVGLAAGPGLDIASRAIAANLPQRSYPRLTVEQQTRNAGLREGLKVAPRFVENSPVGSALEPLASRGALSEEINRANRPIFDALAKRANRTNRDLTIENLEDLAKEAYTRGYEPINALQATFRPGRGYTQALQGIIDKYAGNRGFPGANRKEIAAIVEEFDTKGFTGREAIDAIKRLRTSANDAMNAAQPNQPLGLALRDVASTIENMVEQNLALRGQAGAAMLREFRDARKSIAIAHETMDAVIPGAGSVDPRVFATKLGNRIPLTGELRTMGEFSSAFRPMAEFPAQGEALLYQRPSLGLGESEVGIAGQLLGAPARKILMSDAYQRSLFAPTGARPTNPAAAGFFGQLPARTNQLFEEWDQPE